MAIFASLEGESLEDVSIRLAQQWRIGRKGLDNGAILLVFLKERKLRIEVGYGLEARLTDALAGSIIRDEIVPRFRQQQYGAGIDAGLAAIFRAIAGESRLPAPRPRERLPDQIFLGALALAVVAIVVTVLTNLARGNRSRGLSRGRRGYTASSGGWSFGGGGGGSGGFGGGGGGGFSGGGGSFGGGGSSGSW